jgi:CheY-like chemotaxis protein
VKFTSRGRVSINASAKPVENRTCVVVRVADTGPGIDRKARERLFQAFTQADESTTRRHGGTGLGLAISRDLARMMGGDIVVKSIPGEGSEFTFSFLAEAARPASPRKKAAARDMANQQPSRLRGARVLLTDDNAINRQVARLFLQPQGAVITEAVNGREALDLLAAQSFDLVLLDCNMPVMDGMETIAHIRASREPWSKLPVIALTANAMSGDRERLLALGMSGYVSKPIDRMELYAEIERVLGAEKGSASAAPPPPRTPANDGFDLGEVLRALDRIAKR